MQKPVLSPFHLGNVSSMNLVAVPDLKSPIGSPNKGVLAIKILDADHMDSDILQPVRVPATAIEAFLVAQVIGQLTFDKLWSHFFPGLLPSERNYLLSVQGESGKLRIGAVIGSNESFQRIGLGIG
jgi:hypothetical protein